MSRLILLLMGLFALSTQPLLSQSLEDIERTMIEVDDMLETAQKTGDKTQSEKFALQSLNMARSQRYDGGIIRADLFLGDLYAKAERNEEALQLYLEAESKVQNTLNRPAKLAVNTALGNLFFKEKLYGPARRYYGEVLRIQPENYAVQEKLADASLADMRFDSAEFFYKSLIIKYKNDGDNAKLVHIYQKLAQAYDSSGNASKSLYYYLPIADLIEKYGNLQERAVLYNNLGRQYALLRDFTKAVEFFRKAELQCVYLTCDYQDVMYANMGIALHNLGDSKQGLEYLLKAKKILAAKNDKASLANLEHLTSTVYLNTNDIYNALSHNDLAIRYARETGQRATLANSYRTAADLYQELYDFEKAFGYYRLYLNLQDSVRLEEQARQQRLDQQRTLLAAAEGQIKFMIARQNFKDLELSQERFERDRLDLLNKNLELENQRREDELLLLQKQTEVDQAQLKQRALEALRARQDLRLAAQNLDAEKQQRIITELQQQEKIDSTQRLASVREVELLRRDKDITQLRLDRQASFQKFAYWLGGLLMVILTLLGIGWVFARRSSRRLRIQNQKIQHQNIEIQEERRKSDGLLLNILPEEIATELKTSGHATPRLYPSATVLFTDFINFTSLSSQLSPEQLIDELNACFLAFDEIVERNGLEKIKTIGDAFMCAGGLPVPNETHPYDAVNAALEMCEWLEKRHKADPDTVFYEMRVGVHTGPVVAGVIGKNKFAYDIWGDAVNMAARLEEMGEANKVNISASTVEAVKDRYNIIPRGTLHVHNKGLVEMFFVEKRKD
ncbi:MAG: hypothetical protein IT269_01660 [Saprospiraceae bacterium]|nr:hypothetical protein [Saprospiraceae bacterium]